MTPNLDQQIHKLIENYLIDFSNSEMEFVWSKQNKVISIASFVNNNQYPNIFKESERLQALKKLLLIKVENVGRILQSARIKYVFLKGLNLIPQFPDYADFRDIKDLDILIDEDDLEIAAELLIANGWQMKFPDTKSKIRLELFVNHAVTFIEKSSGVELDLHWKLAEAYNCPSSFSKDYFNQATKQDQMFGYSYPNWEYQVLFLAVHSYKNNWQQLQNIIDLYIILTKAEVDILKAKELAKSYKLDLIFEQTLELVDLHFGLNLSQKSLALDYQKGKERIRQLAEKAEYSRIFNFNKGSNRIKFLFFRYILPFGPDLLSEQNLFKIFINKILRNLYR